MELSIQAEQEIAQGVVVALRRALTAVPGREEVRFAALEGAVQSALRDVGGPCLARVLAEVGTGFVGTTRPCPCGAEQETDHYATGTWQTVVGAVTVRRAAYHCPACQATDIPLDGQVGLPADRTSPLLRALLSLYCAAVPFVEACWLLHKATGLRVSAKRAQLVSEALGAQLEQAQATQIIAGPPVPRVPPLPQRLYLGLDGILYCTREQDEQGKLLWREAKVAVFYTPLPAGAPGTGRRSSLTTPPVPIDGADPESHSYVVHMGDWHSFAAKVWHEGLRRGIEQVRELVVLGDGAEWIVSVRQEVLDGLEARVTQILDIRHAEEHLWDVTRACLGEQEERWITQPLEDLAQGRVDALIAAVRSLSPPTEAAAKLVATTPTYFDERRAQMDYPRFRAQGYHIGSGLAESACKRLVGQREKGAGMHWTVAGAQAIGTLRATALSTRWEEVEALAAA